MTTTKRTTADALSAMGQSELAEALALFERLNHDASTVLDALREFVRRGELYSYSMETRDASMDRWRASASDAMDKVRAF